MDFQEPPAYLIPILIRRETWIVESLLTLVSIVWEHFWLEFNPSPEDLFESYQ